MDKNDMLKIDNFLVPDVPIFSFWRAAFNNFNKISSMEEEQIRFDIVREIVKLCQLPNDYGRLFGTILAYDFSLLSKKSDEIQNKNEVEAKNKNTKQELKKDDETKKIEEIKKSDKKETSNEKNNEKNNDKNNDIKNDKTQ